MMDDKKTLPKVSIKKKKLFKKKTGRNSLLDHILLVQMKIVSEKSWWFITVLKRKSEKDINKKYIASFL